MADRAHDIIIRALGETEDAQGDLEDLGHELLEIDGMSADATVNIDDEEAKASLDDLRADLARFARETAESTALVDTKAAHGKLDSLERELNDIDRDDVNVDVDIDTAAAITHLRLLRAALNDIDNDFVAFGDKTLNDVAKANGRVSNGFSGLSNDIKKLTPDLEDNNTRWRNLGNSQSSVAEQLRRTLGRFGSFLTLATRGAPIISGLGGIIVALASSLTSAALGAGALAISLGSTLVPAGILAIGVIRDFKNHSGDAGTAANDLKKAAHDLGRTFDQALRPAADKVLSGLANVLPAIGDTVTQLAPNFSRLGGAVNDAVNHFAGFITSRQSVDFLGKATNTLADIVRGPGTDAFISFAKVLEHIAVAGLPVLEKAFGDLADSMQGLSKSTGDIDSLREHINNGYDDLKAWIDLGHQVGRVLAGIFKAALPDGRSLVDTLRQGAHQLADWINSASGQNAVKDFLDKVIPPAERFLELGGKILVAFLKWSEFTAPVMGKIFDALGKIVDALSSVLDAVNGLPGPLRDVLAIIALFGGGKIIGAIGTLITIITGRLMGALGSAEGAAAAARAEMELMASLRFVGLIGAIGAMVEAFRLGIPVGHKLADTMTTGVGESIQKALGVTQKVAERVVKYMGDHPGMGASEALAAIRTQPAIDKMNEFLRQAEVDSGATAQAWGKLVPEMKSVLDDFTGAITSKGPSAAKAAKGIAQAGVAAIKALTGDFTGAGHALGEAFATAVGNKEPLSKNAGSALGRAVKLGMEDHRQDMNDEGQTHGERYAGGVSSKEGLAKNVGAGVARAAKQAIADLGGDFNTEGATHGDRYVGGVSSKQGEAGGAGRDLANAAKAAAAAVSADSAGRSLGQSIKDGIASMASVVNAAAVAIMQGAVDAANAYAASHPVNPPKPGGKGKGAMTTNPLADSSITNALAGLTFTPPALAPVAAGGAGGGSAVYQTNYISAPGGAAPDANHLMAQLSALARLRGGLG